MLGLGLGWSLRLAHLCPRRVRLVGAPKHVRPPCRFALVSQTCFEPPSTLSPNTNTYTSTEVECPTKYEHHLVTRLFVVKNTKFNVMGPRLPNLVLKNLKFIYFEILGDFQPSYAQSRSQKAAMTTANSFFSFSSPSCVRK